MKRLDNATKENNVNKKRIVLASIFIIIVVALIALYINTDFLKTKEQLFWKYFGVKKDEVISVISNDNTKEYDSQLKKSLYIREGNFSIKGENGLLEAINAKIIDIGNKAEDCKNINIDVTYKDKNVINAQVIKDDNYFFIKESNSDSKYIGIENANLKQLAQKYGIQNTEFVPDSIKEIDFVELFSFSNNEIKHISNKYVPICREHISYSDYSKRKDGELTINELHLSKKQIQELLIDVLDELYKDDYSLNILANKVKIIDENSKYCSKENIKTKISEIKQFVERQNSDDEKFLSIIIYRKKSHVEKVEFMFKDDRTISVENDDNKIIIKQYDVKDRKIEIDTVKNIAKTIIDSITEITYSKKVTNKEINNVDINVKCDLGIEAISLNYNYEEKIKTTDVELIRKNDIEYIEITKSDKTICEKVLEVVDKVNGIEEGNN